MGWDKILHSLRRDWHNIPNLIATLRIILSPLLPVALLTHPHNQLVWWWVFAAFVVLAATDKVDGYIAKNYNMVTEWGKVLDPVADKVLVVPLLITLCWLHASWVLWAVTVFIIVREIHVTMILKRGAYGRGKIVSARESGRIKMVAHVVMVAAMLVPILPPEYLSAIVVLTATITLWSWWDYIVSAKN